jgi:hypothetical protein
VQRKEDDWVHTNQPVHHHPLTATTLFLWFFNFVMQSPKLQPSRNLAKFVYKPDMKVRIIIYSRLPTGTFYELWQHGFFSLKVRRIWAIFFMKNPSYRMKSYFPG